jgi:glutamate-ammonia-ligase adenylyltransferase
MLLSPHYNFRELPPPAHAAWVERGSERLAEAASRTEDPLHRYFADVAADAAGARLLAALFGNSPYLESCLIRDLPFARLLLAEGPDAAEAAIGRSLAALHDAATTTEALSTGLRRTKRQIALTVALADIAGIWPLHRLTGSLSGFCDRALGAALDLLLRQAAQAGAVRLDDASAPAERSGLFVLGMGKLGAGELNYSSDIDLIVLYDEERVATDAPDTLQRTFVRLTRALVKMMEERTREGYVFRTDLRLRPDPGATPPALSTLAAETYYESMGQNWERAAMIKARPAAGDREAGLRFLEILRPYVWRRHLDFAAIDDIHSIKRQIHAHKGGSTVAIEGHDVKLGRGGIREVEFFAQTQQLIWGGREPDLRLPGTVDAIRALVGFGRVDAAVGDDMIAAYRYLRKLEHRLQMVDDRQTQKLPADADGVAAIAAFMGYRDAEPFRAELLRHLRTVESHYAELFEEAPSLGATGVGAEGSLVFTGGEDHPETLATLAALGFHDASSVAATIRGWHHGRYRATRATRARELLTELMPALLGALGATANPDQAFRKFDEFLRGLPAGVQLFSLFHANPSLLDLVAEIMGASPALAEALSRNPLLLDGVLDSDFFGHLPDAAEMAAALAERLAEARDMQDVLDLTRRWASDARFQVGVHVLRNTIGIDRAGLAFSDIADTCIRALLPYLAEEFATRHGSCPGDGFAVLGLGKLGGRELTATSDIDLVFLYDAPAERDGAPPVESDGAKPLTIGRYHQRLGQRLVNAITAMTGEGKLFEVDMRLRPSGNAGPLAISLEAFARYQRDSAWTWEHLALTRARVVAAAPAFAARIEAAIGEALCRERPADELLVAVAEMRARIAAEHKAPSVWRVKHLRGGLVDCEFIAQYLQLRNAHDRPEVLDTGTVPALDKLAQAGLLDRRIADELIEATRLWRRIQGLRRITAEAATRTADFPPQLRAALARAGEAVDFAALERKVHAVAERTLAHYRAIIDEPAARIAAARAPGERGNRGETSR